MDWEHLPHLGISAVWFKYRELSLHFVSYSIAMGYGALGDIKASV